MIMIDEKAMLRKFKEDMEKNPEKIWTTSMVRERQGEIAVKLMPDDVRKLREMVIETYKLGTLMGWKMSSKLGPYDIKLPKEEKYDRKEHEKYIRNVAKERKAIDGVKGVLVGGKLKFDGKPKWHGEKKAATEMNEIKPGDSGSYVRGEEPKTSVSYVRRVKPRR